MKNLFLGIIPARYASTRFPGKPLAMLGGKPMIQWVWERAFEVFNHLVVATDDQRIMDAVLNFGGNAVMTSPNHSTGTERCAEAMEIFQRKNSLEITHVVNIQGDEPLLNTSHMVALKSSFKDEDTQIATLIQPIASVEELTNPNVVKVVCDLSSKALYFSRSPIPHGRNSSPEELIKQQGCFRHMGLYAFRANILPELVKLRPTLLEQAESLEQLRWMENGYIIRTQVTNEPSMGVDTPEDLEAISRII
jgi:3-deoxy-manno-octulosonate cytidylyltransferase (CMP-KDO synthetase)